MKNSPKRPSHVPITLCLVTAAIFATALATHVAEGWNVVFTSLLFLSLTSALAFSIARYKKVSKRTNDTASVLAFFVAGLVGFSSLATFSSPTIAVTKETQKNADTLQEIRFITEEQVSSTVNRIQLAKDELHTIETPDAQTFADIAKRSKYVTRSGNLPDWNRYKTFQHKDYFLVAVPIELPKHKGRDIDIANRLVFFIKGEVVESVFESSAIPSDESGAHVRIWIDGENRLDEAIGTSSTLTANKGLLEPSGIKWKQLNECLSNLGLSSWLFGFISLACGAACVGTAGIGCAACISFATGFAAGSVEQCVRDAWD